MEAFVVKENCLASASPPLKKRRIDNHTGTEAKADGSAILAFNSNIGSDERQLNVAAFGNNSNNHEIDDHLHSRQLPVYGRETISRRFPSNVLISGMQDLGVEIAKNIILAGVKSVTLHDENVVELWDLSSNFVFSEEDIGKNRALASVQKLQELNNAVAVSTLTDKLTNEKLSAFHAVVFVDISSEKATQFDDYCHSHQPPIAFIKADVMGLFGSLFCDFGPQFTVLDLDGEEPHSGIIASVSNENPAFVLCVDDERLEFEDGDLVVFSEVERVAELNDGKPRKINSVKPYSIFLEEDTTSYGAYKKDGVVTQVKQPKVLNYNREAIKDPGDFLLSDFSKFDWPPLLRLAFQALDRFSSQAGRFPFAGSEEDAQKLVDIAVDINESLGDARLGDVNSKLLGHLAFVSMAVLNPMAAMFGGIVGQEVVKACSGNLALMGVSCGVQGRLTVTDDDVIDKSNLSRQFLFRDWNIGQAKSTVAATGGKKGEESSLGKKLASESTSGKADGIASSSDKDGNSSASYTGGFEKEGSAQFDQEDDDSWSKPSWKKKTHRKVESKEGDEYKIKVHIDLPTVGFVKGFDVCENLCNSIISTVKKIKQQDGKFFVSEINVHGLRHMEKYAKTTFSRLSAKYRFYAERYFYCGNCKEEETVVEGEEKPPLLEMGMMNEIYKEAIDLQDEEYKSLLLVISGDPYFSRAVKKFSKVKRGIEGCVLIQIPVGMFALDMYKPRPRPNLQRAIVKIYVTEPLGGGRFYAQLVEDPRMVEIRNQLAAFTSLNAPLDRSFKPKRGEIVLAQFSVDKFWYRAKIVSAPQAAVQSPDGQFKVFYIDYGNQETVPYSAIRRLDRSLTSAPGCAKLCRLAYIKVSLSYESEALEYLDNITSQGVKVCEATIEGKFKSGEWRGQGTGPGFSVTIKVVGEDISINAALLEKRDKWEDEVKKAALDALELHLGRISSESPVFSSALSRV